MGVARGWGEGDRGSECLMNIVFVPEGDNILELGRGGGCPNKVKVLNATELSAEKRL